MIDRFLRDAFGVSSGPFWSTVLQCGARLPIHTINHWTKKRSSGCFISASDARFLTRGVIECDITHRRSVAVLCMLDKIRCNPMHPLNGALPGSYVQVPVTRNAPVVHRYTYTPPRCRTSQYHMTFVPLSVSLWKDLADPVLDGVGLAGFKSRANAFLLA